MVLLALALGGCGSSNSAADAANQYAQEVQQAQFVFSNSFEEATGRLESTSEPGSDAEALRDAAKAVAVDVNALRRIKPPKGVTALHQKLISVMTVYGTSIKNAAKLVADGKPQAFPVAQALLTKSSKHVRVKFNAIINQINDKLSG
jgi:hypothetical protein